MAAPNRLPVQHIAPTRQMPAPHPSLSLFHEECAVDTAGYVRTAALRRSFRSFCGAHFAIWRAPATSWMQVDKACGAKPVRQEPKRLWRAPGLLLNDAFRGLLPNPAGNRREVVIVFAVRGTSGSALSAAFCNNSPKTVIWEQLEWNGPPLFRGRGGFSGTHGRRRPFLRAPPSGRWHNRWREVQDQGSI